MSLRVEVYCYRLIADSYLLSTLKCDKRHIFNSKFTTQSIKSAVS